MNRNTEAKLSCTRHDGPQVGQGDLHQKLNKIGGAHLAILQQLAETVPSSQQTAENVLTSLITKYKGEFSISYNVKNQH